MISVQELVSYAHMISRKEEFSRKIRYRIVVEWKNVISESEISRCFCFPFDLFEDSHVSHHMSWRLVNIDDDLIFFVW